MPQVTNEPQDFSAESTAGPSGTDQARFLQNSKMFEDHLAADRQLTRQLEALAPG